MEKKEMNEAEIIEYLNKVLDNRVLKFVVKRMARIKRIERAFGIYAGMEDGNAMDKVYAGIIGGAIEKGAKKFNVERETIRNFLKDPYMRKAFAVIIGSIAEYGITVPQRLLAPFMVVWNFTKQCNLKCRHCYANASNKPAEDELTLEERKEVVDQLDEAGVAAISFSGGEPLANKDFWEVAEYAKSKGFYLAVATNGTLITEKVAERLKEVGVRYVEISLDGPDAKTHDEFRGVEGAFERAVRGIENVRDAGISTGIATTVTHYNMDKLPEIIELARKLRVDRFIAFNFIPTGRAKDIVEEDLTPEERERLMNYLYDEWQKGKMQIFSTSPSYARISITRRGGKISPTHCAELELPEEYGGAAKALSEFIGGCGAGRIYCSIEHNGDIQPCVFMPIKVGNALKDGFINVWKNSEVMRMLRDRDASDYACNSCSFRYVCGGCRARAYAYFGDVRAPDPGCILKKKDWERLNLKEAIIER